MNLESTPGGGNGSAQTVAAEKKADVSTPKGAREYLQEFAAAKQRHAAAISTLKSAIKADMDLVAQISPEHSYRDGSWTKQDLIKDMFPGEIGCIEGNAERREQQKLIPAAIVGAIGSALYGGFIGNVAGRAAGYEAGKKARPVTSLAAERVIDWLVSKL